MKSKFMTMLVVLIILASSALTVWAGLHFSGGAGFGSGSVIINVSMVGVSGGRTATVNATITDGYNLTAVCRNNGGNIAYGQRPVNLSNISASQVVTADSNGNATSNFRIDVISQAGITWQVAGCPNKNWRVTDLLGGIHVSLTASDGSFTDTQHYSCFVSDIDRIISCTQN
jgi:hypothetical protein